MTFKSMPKTKEELVDDLLEVDPVLIRTAIAAVEDPLSFTTEEIKEVVSGLTRVVAIAEARKILSEKGTLMAIRHLSRNGVNHSESMQVVYAMKGGKSTK